MNKIENRKRDINKLNPEQLEQLSQKLGEKVRDIVDEAVEKSNQILNMYGMRARMQIVFEPLEEKKE